jgi:ribosomal-protein-alanine N-acetyltransferase
MSAVDHSHGDGPADRRDDDAIRLRELRWWDVERVMPLEQDLFGPTAWSAESFWSELAHPESRRYWVAERDTELGADRGADPGADPGAERDAELLGYAGLMVTGAEADVQTVAVAPSAQGRGIGALLLRELIGEAGRRGATSLLLEVRADNEAAIALYTRHGFERIGVRRRYYQPGDIDAHVMRLRPVPRRDAGSRGGADPSPQAT